METILCEHRPSPMKLEVMGVYDWAVWKKEVCSFTRYCKDTETHYFARGKAIVTSIEGERREFHRGDLVTFPAGSYAWEILKPVETYYDAQ